MEPDLVSLDADDVADLYARRARPLVAFFARRTYDAEVAVELMAETFAAVVAGRARFRGSGDEAAVAWLYAIARHRLADWLRHARVQRQALSQLGIEPPQLSDAELERIDELAGTAALRPGGRPARGAGARSSRRAAAARRAGVLLRGHRGAAGHQRADRAGARFAGAARAGHAWPRRRRDTMPERDDFADLPGLARFGEALDAAARRAPARGLRLRRWLRGATLALAVLLGVAATAAATVAALRGTVIPAPDARVLPADDLARRDERADGPALGRSGGRAALGAASHAQPDRPDLHDRRPGPRAGVRHRRRGPRLPPDPDRGRRLVRARAAARQPDRGRRHEPGDPLGRIRRRGQRHPARRARGRRGSPPAAPRCAWHVRGGAARLSGGHGGAGRADRRRRPRHAAVARRPARPRARPRGRARLAPRALRARHAPVLRAAGRRAPPAGPERGHVKRSPSRRLEPAHRVRLTTRRLCLGGASPASARRAAGRPGRRSLAVRRSAAAHDPARRRARLPAGQASRGQRCRRAACADSDLQRDVRARPPRHRRSSRATAQRAATDGTTQRGRSGHGIVADLVASRRPR